MVYLVPPNQYRSAVFFGGLVNFDVRAVFEVNVSATRMLVAAERRAETKSVLGKLVVSQEDICVSEVQRGAIIIA